jgi:uncharacterized RDD family membrane protein YckC
MWIDLLVFLPLSWARSWLESRSKGAAMGLVIHYAVIGLGYTIYGHGRFGQTVGKWVMAVRVVRTNGKRIGWRQAWLRSSVDLLFTVLGVVGQLAALVTILDAEYYGDRRTEDVFAHTPGWAVWAVWIGIIWSLSEVVTMLLNKRRRALHDFIAGTVVIHEPRVRAARHEGGEAKPP